MKFKWFFPDNPKYQETTPHTPAVGARGSAPENVCLDIKKQKLIDDTYLPICRSKSTPTYLTRTRKEVGRAPNGSAIVAMRSSRINVFHLSPRCGVLRTVAKLRSPVAWEARGDFSHGVVPPGKYLRVVVSGRREPGFFFP